MSTSQCSECGAPVPARSAEGCDSSLNITVAPAMLARYQELLTTNAVPQGTELPFIQVVVSKTDARLADVEKEISRLRDRLQQLEDERASLSRYQAQNYAVISPLRRMPPEVLGEIFSWTLPDFRHTLGRRRFDITSSPWLLTHISSRWRAVALSNASLWSVVVCSPQSASPLSILEAQIARSQSRTLTIHFYGDDSLPPGPQMRIFEFLATYSHRWEGLGLGIARGIMPVLAANRHRFPLLRRLWMEWAIDPEPMEAIDYFRTAPSLVDVGVYNPYHSTSIPMPVDQLTRYEFTGSSEMHLHLLWLGRNLVEVHIDVDGDLGTSSGILDVPSLRRLYISHSAFLDFIRVPALEEIALSVGENPDPIPTYLESLIQRSSCPLRKICLVGVPHAHIATEILNKNSSITELGIILSDPHFSPEVTALMASLTVANRDMPMAPQLCCMSFGCEKSSSIDYSMYLAMVESRWNSGDCVLKRAALLIDSGSRPDSVTLSRLSELTDDGLELLVLGEIEATKAMDGLIFRMLW